MKDQVLQILSGHETVSGESLGRELGVSRNAVWKAVDRLRKEGYLIEAVTNNGYRLVSAPDILSESGIRRWLTSKSIGQAMELHENLDSTNICAKALAAAGAPHGFLVAAEAQSAGRGRLGRSFFSPAHSGIYVSFILRPACSPEKASMITSLAAVAAAEAIEDLTPADVRIKWVNDLYIGNRKICGILSEAGMGMETGRLDYVIVGIGVNVGRMVFPPELQDIAGSVGNETGVVPDRNRLIAGIANRLEARFGQLETGAFLSESRRRSNVIGRDVLVIDGEKQYPARALDIDHQGRLVIQTETGTETLGYGEVSLKLNGGARL